MTPFSLFQKPKSQKKLIKKFPLLTEIGIFSPAIRQIEEQNSTKNSQHAYT
ncbi:hypothetical protein MAH1_11370 [Sessilibacter sp. MAH1]